MSTKREPQPYQNALPATELTDLLARIKGTVKDVEGWLSERETEFLSIVAACPTARGAILEIGSFRGRSTIAIAMAELFARHHLQQTSEFTAVDPMLDDDPLMRKATAPGTALASFEHNLANANVRQLVDFRQAFSYEVAGNWNQPLRLLWIDGDHAYPSTKQDYDLFAPHLADGAILAMHDVLSRYDGCIRVFCEDVLASPHFGAVGLCGSIGWAQYWHKPRHEQQDEQCKQHLLGQLQRLLPYHLQAEQPRGLSKLRYKWLRSRVPHQRTHPDQWLAQVTSNVS